MKNKRKKNSGFLFKSIANNWLSDVKFRVKRSTYEKYTYLLERHIMPYFGDRFINRLTIGDVDKFKREKLQNGKLKRNEGLSKKYLQDILSIIKSIAHYFETVYNIRCQFVMMRGLRPQKPKVNILNRTERNKLTDELKRDTTPEKLGIMLGLYAGLRIGEVCGLRWSDFDEVNGTITINRTVQRISDNRGGTVFLVSEPKTEASKRIIPLPKFLSEKLDSIRCNNDDPIISHDGKYTEPSRLRAVFNSVLRACNIAGRRFHDLRHSFASACVSMNCDTKLLSEIMGHSSVSITLDRYVHCDLEAKREFMQRIVI